MGKGYFGTVSLWPGESLLGFEEKHVFIHNRMTLNVSFMHRFVKFEKVQKNGKKTFDNGVFRWYYN